MNSNRDYMKTETEPYITFEVKGLKCLHCGYEWVPRFDRLPSYCPSCRSKNYLQPRQRKAHTKTRRVNTHL